MSFIQQKHTQSHELLKRGHGTSFGVVMGKAHWLALESLDNPQHAKGLLGVYRRIIHFETDLGLVRQYTHDGRNWVRKDVRI